MEHLMLPESREEFEQRLAAIEHRLKVIEAVVFKGNNKESTRGSCVETTTSASTGEIA